MKKQKLLIALFLLLMLPTAPIFANEVNRGFGDRSWQFKTPNDKIIDNQRLMIRCQADPESCPKGFPATGGSGGPGGGTGLANGTAVGNITTVVITGDGNTVTTGSQSNVDSNQTVKQEVSDNVLDINNHTQVLNGDVTGDVNTTNNTTDNQPQ
jgi:hypothetical protein